MPSAPKRVEHGVDDEDSNRELRSMAAIRCDDERGRHVRDGEAEQHERDQAGADHPALDQHRGVHRAGAGEQRPRRSGSRATRTVAAPNTMAAQRGTTRPRTISSLHAVRPDEARLPEQVGAPEEQGGGADAEELRQADGATRADHRIAVAARDEQHRRRDQQPAGRPEQDERLAPVRVLQQQQAGDDCGAKGEGVVRVDQHRRHVRAVPGAGLHSVHEREEHARRPVPPLLPPAP